MFLNGTIIKWHQQGGTLLGLGILAARSRLTIMLAMWQFKVSGR